MMKKILSVFFLACCSCIVMAQDNVIDEIVWVVGDDAILRSDIETQRLYNQNEGVRLDGDPYCVIPEQMAIQKLYLNQAKIDSITVNENQVIQSVDQWMNMAVNQIGSREKLEEYFGKKFSQIKDERKEMVREQQVVQQMQHQLIGEIKLTPSEVRKYFSQLSQDSLPNIPTTVEVQIVTLEPKIPFEETDAIKARLRDFTEQVNSGKMEFSTLARLYSEDPGSASRGGELGFMSKTQLLPESQLDRFMICMSMGYPSHDAEVDIAKGKSVKADEYTIKPVMNAQGLVEMQGEVEQVFIHDSIYSYIVDLVDATRTSPYIELGVSPRGTIACVRMAKAYAYLSGRSYVIPSDVVSVFADVTKHRIVLNTKARVSHVPELSVIDEILKAVKQPTTYVKKAGNRD